VGVKCEMQTANGELALRSSRNVLLCEGVTFGVGIGEEVPKLLTAMPLACFEAVYLR
jgi:hypothetical protein